MHPLAQPQQESAQPGLMPAAALLGLPIPDAAGAGVASNLSLLAEHYRIVAAALRDGQ